MSEKVLQESNGVYKCDSVTQGKFFRRYILLNSIPRAWNFTIGHYK